MNPTAHDLADRIRRAPPACGALRVICVDGPAGSGKTTLAEALARELAHDGITVPVIHMDDLYDGWAQDLAELGARVRAWLLDPWAAGLPGRHLRYDWHAGRYTSWAEVPPAQCIILEGCGSASARIRDRSCFVVWVEAPPPVRTERGLARDGVAMAAPWRRWQDHEDAHFAADGTRGAADAIVDGTTGEAVDA